MVDHDSVHALRLQVGQLVVGVGSAVQGDEEVRLAGLQRAIDRPATESIALLQPPWHHKARIQTKSPQHADQKRRAADAVDIVVAKHHQRLLSLDRPAETRDSGIQVDEQEWVLEAGQRRPEELRGRRGLLQSIARQQFGQDRADLQTFADLLHFGRRQRRVNPAHGDFPQGTV